MPEDSGASSIFLALWHKTPCCKKDNAFIDAGTEPVAIVELRRGLIVRLSPCCLVVAEYSIMVPQYSSKIVFSVL